MKRFRIVKIVLWVIVAVLFLNAIGYCWSIIRSSFVAIDTNSYVRYRLYTGTHNPPNHFITFDQVNIDDEFSFENFRLSEKVGQEKYHNYSYRLSLRNGFCLALKVRHVNHFTYEHETIDLPENVEDVRDFQATSECRHVRVGDIEYSYVKDSSTGEYILYGVTMVIDDIQFTWYMSDSRYPEKIDFPDDPDSFIERLLHASTATQARDEFAASIRSAQPSQLGWQVLFVGTPVLVVSGLVVLFIFQKKKREST